VEKEKEIARLRAQQERAKDKQAEKVTEKCLHPLSWFHSSFVFIFGREISLKLDSKQSYQVSGH